MYTCDWDPFLRCPAKSEGRDRSGDLYILEQRKITDSARVNDKKRNATFRYSPLGFK